MENNPFNNVIKMIKENKKEKKDDNTIVVDDSENPSDFQILKECMVDCVKPINSIINQRSNWSFQREKNGTLLHEDKDYRAYIYDSSLVLYDEQRDRVAIWIDRIKNVNYYKYIKKNNDMTNDFEEKCSCNTYEKVINCKVCKFLREDIASRSFGKKYDDEKLPKWNLTYRAGGLRTKPRVFHGTYKVRAKTKLICNCVSFIKFSSLEPVKDHDYPNTGFWEEISIQFSQNKKEILLFIKSSSSKRTKKELILPIEIKNKSFNMCEYNNYVLEWKHKTLVIKVNSTIIYKTSPNDPVPQLPGSTYFGIRPNYNTNSVDLIKQIKRDTKPNIYIKSFSYTPLE